MLNMKLKDILLMLPFYETTANIDSLDIHSIEIDHRLIKVGDLFICQRGFTVDGHEFAQQAIDNGACAVVSEQHLNLSVPIIHVADTNRALALISAMYYNFPSEKFPLVGVTGTNGKTTTTYLLDAIFKQMNQKTGLIGTIQITIGQEAYAVKNTTPDALQLQKTFHDMYNKSVDIGIMEVSSHALDLGRVYGCDFDIAVFTNLSQDHLDYHKTMDQYFFSKSFLFSQLGNTYQTARPKYAIINNDDPYSAAVIKSTAQPLLTYGCKQTSDVRAQNIKLSASQTSFKVITPVGNMMIYSHLIGKFNVYNILAAISVAVAQRIPLCTIKQAIENVKGINGRFEQVTAGQKYAVIVDFAHTPGSLENVLQTIQQFSKGDIYVVVGCGGNRDRTKRSKMADVSLTLGDYAIFTSDNPRTESATDILFDMTDHINQSHYEVIENRKDAIFQAIQYANNDDVVLIAGKGHEVYQEINGITYEFDDRAVAREAIRQKGQ